MPTIVKMNKGILIQNGGLHEGRALTHFHSSQSA